MLKGLLTQYKSVFKFLAWFVGSYLVLTLLYNGYLLWSNQMGYSPDFITRLVARQSELIINWWGFDAQVVPDLEQPHMQLFVNTQYVARIIEGCNAMSIMALFAAFVIAFKSSFKQTLLFILAGSVLIYAINLLRIAILAIALYKYPEYESLLHGVVFPGLIYGLVFVLWVLWTRKLPKPAVDE